MYWSKYSRRISSHKFSYGRTVDRQIESRCHFRKTHPLVCETFPVVCFNKTEHISLSDRIICAMVIFNESDSGSCLIFIKGGWPIGRFRPLSGFGRYFRTWDASIPNTWPNTSDTTLMPHPVFTKSWTKTRCWLRDSNSHQSSDLSRARISRVEALGFYRVCSMASRGQAKTFDGIRIPDLRIECDLRGR
jgi:hypothetical protein